MTMFLYLNHDIEAMKIVMAEIMTLLHPWCINFTMRKQHAPPLLRKLRWLPVSSRIQFKLCTLMFDINHGTAPQYLSELVRRCDDTRLRSNVRGNFVVSRTRLHVTNKAFSIAGPRAWNALPSDIKLISTHTSFRKRLKTHFLVASSLNFY